ncbi:MAG: hypothetical protein QM811_22035 [Pirellulales bacterium]
MARSSSIAFRYAILAVVVALLMQHADVRSQTTPAPTKAAAPPTSPPAPAAKSVPAAPAPMPATTTPAATTPGAKSATPAAVPAERQLFGWLAELDKAIPADITGYRKLDAPKLVLACNSVDQWSAEVAHFAGLEQPDKVLENAGYLIIAKSRVEELMERVLEQRVLFADPSGKTEIDGERRVSIVNYLQTTTALIDLNARLRYLQRDAIETAADLLAEARPQYLRLIELLTKYKSTVGAVVMADPLLDPPPGNPDGLVPLTPDLKRAVIKLIVESGATELLDILVGVVKAQTQPSSVRLAAAQAIVDLGLPQQVRSGSDPTLPKPATTPAQLHEAVRRISTEKFDAAQKKSYDALLAAIAARMKSGLTEDVYRLGRYEIRPGDWMLMRNPSPYNMFTDLSPGLFTHVGVAAMETGPDGVRRMVLVDLPERGTNIPATNIEIYLQRTLNYVFLRHPDPKIAGVLATAAADCIGNPSEFDLNFRTDRVTALLGKPLKGAKIHTYCAGFLLVGATHRLAARRVLSHRRTRAGRKRAGQLQATGALLRRRLHLADRRVLFEQAETDRAARSDVRSASRGRRGGLRSLRVPLSNRQVGAIAGLPAIDPQQSSRSVDHQSAAGFGVGERGERGDRYRSGLGRQGRGRRRSDGRSRLRQQRQVFQRTHRDPRWAEPAGGRRPHAGASRRTQSSPRDARRHRRPLGRGQNDAALVTRGTGQLLLEGR